MAQMYKGHDILLRAVAGCIAEGWNLRLILVGDGQYRSLLEGISASLGLSDRVEFVGQIPAGKAVRSELDRADLFVMPSLAEGLPRALLEAMARGLPCVGTTVGGIPELLAADDLVSPGDSTALAKKITSVLASPERLSAMAHRNRAVAQHFCEEDMRRLRLSFLNHVQERTWAWIRSGVR
jgi:glycosyltransferase involved in cell wall biosynthesis